MNKSTSAATHMRPLSLRLRHLRQLHPTASLGQAQLAALAGMTTRQLRDIEATRTMPKSLRPWLALAAALRCSVEDLVAPHELGRLRASVTGEPVPPLLPPVVSVLCRTSGGLALCISDNTVLEFRSLSGTSRGVHARGFTAAQAVQLALDYGAERIVTDDASGLDIAVDGTRIDVLRMKLTTVLNFLQLDFWSRAAAADRVLAHLPSFSRFVRRHKRTGEVDPFDRRVPTALQACAYALAAQADIATSVIRNDSLSSPPTVCTTTP